MPSLEDLAEQYFGSLNPLAKKFTHDIENLKRKYTNWEELSADEQSELIDGCIIDPSTREKYADTEQLPSTSSFPKPDVQTGQKIVVDSDNDCITWKDEHSAPFMYATQAQLDFSISGRSQEKSPLRKKQIKTNKDSNTEHKEATAAKPGKSIWNSPFLKGKLGHVNTAYSGTASEDESSSSQPDIFRTFGVTLTASDNSGNGVSGESSTDESSLLNAPQISGNSEPHNGLKSPFDIWKGFESESIKGGRVVSKRNKSESEENLLGDSDLDSSPVLRNENTPAEAINESTPLSVAVLDISNSTDFKIVPTLNTPSPVNGESFCNWTALDEDKYTDTMTSDLTFEGSDGEKSASDHERTGLFTVSKSGFAFLDNW